MGAYGYFTPFIQYISPPKSPQYEVKSCDEFQTEITKDLASYRCWNNVDLGGVIFNLPHS